MNILEKYFLSNIKPLKLYIFLRSWKIKDKKIFAYNRRAYIDW